MLLKLLEWLSKREMDKAIKVITKNGLTVVRMVSQDDKTFIVDQQGGLHLVAKDALGASAKPAKPAKKDPRVIKPVKQNDEAKKTTK
jgi:hypothetical protein